MMLFRVLDIETVPDLTVWTPGEVQWRLVPVVEKAHIAGVAKVEQFPPPQAHRVVAIALVDVKMDVEKSPRYAFDGCSSDCAWAPDGSMGETDDQHEATLLESFRSRMDTDPIPANLVTWNGRGFDLPVLSMRSLKHGIPFGWYYGNRDMRYRFSDAGHLDLMDFLGDYGAARNMKLSDVARLVGLPGKTDMTGASVSDAYEESRRCPESARIAMERVRRYCLQDTIQTALIFLRTRFHLGKIDQEEYNRCLKTFSDSDLIQKAIEVDWDRVRLQEACLSG